MCHYRTKHVPMVLSSLNAVQYTTEQYSTIHYDTEYSVQYSNGTRQHVPQIRTYKWRVQTAAPVNEWVHTVSE